MNHRGIVGPSIFAWRFPRRIRLWLGHVPRCGSAGRPSHRRPRTVMRGHCQEHGDVNRHFTDTGKGVWPFARQWRAANPPDLVLDPPPSWWHGECTGASDGSERFTWALRMRSLVLAGPRSTKAVHQAWLLSGP